MSVPVGHSLGVHMGKEDSGELNDHRLSGTAGQEPWCFKAGEAMVHCDLPM